MTRLAHILKVFGGVLLVYSAVITFKLELSQELEDIIYFRGILLGGIMLLLGSAITTNSIIVQNTLMSLCFGNFMVFVASIYNLVNDEGIDLDVLFDIAIYATLAGMVAIIIIRLWSRRHFLKK